MSRTANTNTALKWDSHISQTATCLASPKNVLQQNVKKYLLQRNLHDTRQTMLLLATKLVQLYKKIDNMRKLNDVVEENVQQLVYDLENKIDDVTGFNEQMIHLVTDEMKGQREEFDCVVSYLVKRLNIATGPNYYCSIPVVPDDDYIPCGWDGLSLLPYARKA